MRIGSFLMLTTIVLFASLGFSATTQENQPGVATASVEKRLTTTQPVMVTVTVRNNSKSDVITLEDTLIPARDVRLAVMDSKGAKVPFTRYGEWMLKPRSTRRESVVGHEIAPGKELSVRIQADRLYDMSLEGKYTITAQRLVYGPDGKSYEVSCKPVEVVIEAYEDR
jgi:hypothetical protein